MNIGTESDPVYDWEWITTKQLEIDLTNYVEKEDGKGLSTNDFTNADKTKLDSIVTNDIPKTIDGDVTGEIISVNDVSPLPHDVTVKVSGGDTEGGEVLTKTETLSTKGAAVLLDNPASSVRVVVSGGAYCVGGLVPTVSGDDLTVSGVREQLAIWPTLYYGEAPGVYDLEYTISGDTLSWSGVKYEYDASDSSMNEAVSGSVELSTTGQKITGFCQVYGLDEDNPYAEHPEWDTLNMTVEVYESTPSVEVKVCGKNLFKPTSARQIGGVVPDKFSVQEDGSVKIVGGAGISINYALNPNPTLPAGTYTFKGTNTDKFIYYVFTLKNGVQTGWYNGTFTLNEGDTIQYLQVRDAPDYTGAFDDVINVQIEVGSAATDYEPYREPVTYTPNADGTVDNVRSIAPNMSIFTDTVGVLVNAKYNKDINKTINLAPFGDEDRQIATIGDISNSELITIEDIDTICGSTISYVDLNEGEF